MKTSLADKAKQSQDLKINRVLRWQLHRQEYHKQVQLPIRCLLPGVLLPLLCWSCSLSPYLIKIMYLPRSVLQKRICSWSGLCMQLSKQPCFGVPLWCSGLRIWHFHCPVVQVAAVVRVRPLAQELPHVPGAAKHTEKPKQLCFKLSALAAWLYFVLLLAGFFFIEVLFGTEHVILAHVLKHCSPPKCTTWEDFCMVPMPRVPLFLTALGLFRCHPELPQFLLAC